MDHVLYFVADPSRAALDAAREGLDRTIRRVSAQRRQKVHLAFEQSAARALAKLRSGGTDALVIDARGEIGGIEESSSLALRGGRDIEVAGHAHLAILFAPEVAENVASFLAEPDPV